METLRLMSLLICTVPLKSEASQVPIYGGAQDDAWNEIDLGWSARTDFTSPYMTLAYLTPGNGKTWLEKKKDFDSSNGYTGSMNRSMLTYRIEWRKGRISWYVEGVHY